MSGSPALDFGSAIHKGLEHWYQLPPKERELPKNLHEKAEVMAFGQNIEKEAEHPALESVRQFVLSRWETLHAIPENDKRSLHNGVKILTAYFKKYFNDRFEVARDADGPMVERNVSFKMFEDDQLEIHYFGTIDVILRNTDSGVLLVTDHKTTSALGAEFYNRCKPNFQYTGYVLAAREALGLDTNLFMINGLQVAKTKQEFARQITERTECDFDELRDAVYYRTIQWLDMLEHNTFPMTPPTPCSSYGGCQFIRVCEAPKQLRESIIRAAFVEEKDET